MTYDGIDRYEAESIAERVAREVGDGVRTDVGYELEDMRRELRDVRRAAEAAQQDASTARRELSDLRAEFDRTRGR